MNNENSQITKSNVIAHVLRLTPHQNIYEEILKYLKNNNINAAFIMTCVGSLRKINIRLANAQDFIVKEENHEIVSIVGCVSLERSHIHICLSDNKGATIGGHLMQEGNLVNTTAELVLGELPSLKFGLEFDEETGYDELKIKNI